MAAPTRRPDPQCDYEDPIDRVYRRKNDSKERKPPAAANTSAAVAYYLGLIALVPCLGAVLGPVAMLMGVIGLVAARKPKVGGKGRAKSGLWFGLIAVLINYAVPLALYLLFSTLR